MVLVALAPMAPVKKTACPAAQEKEEVKEEQRCCSCYCFGDFLGTGDGEITSHMSMYTIHGV